MFEPIRQQRILKRWNFLSSYEVSLYSNALSVHFSYMVYDLMRINVGQRRAM